MGPTTGKRGGKRAVCRKTSRKILGLFLLFWGVGISDTQALEKSPTHFSRGGEGAFTVKAVVEPSPEWLFVIRKNSLLEVERGKFAPGAPMAVTVTVRGLASLPLSHHQVRLRLLRQDRAEEFLGETDLEGRVVFTFSSPETPRESIRVEAEDTTYTVPILLDSQANLFVR